MQTEDYIVITVGEDIAPPPDRLAFAGLDRKLLTGAELEAIRGLDPGRVLERFPQIVSIDRDAARVRPIAITTASMPRSEARALTRESRDHFPVPRKLPVRLIRPLRRPANATNVPGMWGLGAVGALESPKDGSGITVAILDTGCNLKHPAFKRLAVQRRLVARNFTAGTAKDVKDSDGHGTHCAGVMCGDKIDGQRVGVAPGIDKLVVGKVLGRGGGEAEQIVRALNWAADEGASIVSVSIGFDFPLWVKELRQAGYPIEAATSIALEDYRDSLLGFSALADALAARNVLVVAASGNESDRPTYTIDKSPPAAAKAILSVGAVDVNMKVAEFSNTNPSVVAPGVDIKSARAKGKFSVMSGTSMAAPHVAGVAALWAEELASLGALTHGNLMARVVGNARPIPGGRFSDVGVGLVRAP